MPVLSADYERIGGPTGLESVYDSPMQPLAVHYAYGMVVLSVAISVIAAYAAFSLADRMHGAETRKAHVFWLTCGSCAMGIGIWSMHYVGMFALHLPVDVYYFLPMVLFSLLMAIAASVVALLVVSSDTLGTKRLVGAGLLMGAGNRRHALLGHGRDAGQ